MTYQLLICEHPFQILPTLAQTIGFNEAVVLQEVHYWLDSQINNNFLGNRRWVENLSEQLQRRFSFWSEEVIGHTIDRLEKLGVLISFMSPDSHQGSPKIKYHTINYQLLNDVEIPPLEEGDKKLCRQMIKIWNKTVQNKLYLESEATLTSKRLKLLIQFLEEILGPSRSWETYCELISQYGLVGKVTLDWAIVPTHAYKIFEAEIKNTSAYKTLWEEKPWAEFFQEIKKILQKSPYDAELFQILQTLAKRLGQGIYRTWFLGIPVLYFTEKMITFQIDSTFKKEYIKKYFLLDLAYAVQTAYPTINRIDFQAIPQ